MKWTGPVLITALLTDMAARTTHYSTWEITSFAVALWCALVLMIHDRKGDSDE